MRAIVLVALIVVGYLIYKLYFKKLMQQGKPGQIKLGMIALGLVFLALALTGRAPAIFALLGAAMTQIVRFAPLLIRMAPSLRRYLGGVGMGAAGMGAAGASGFGNVGGSDKQTSRVRTPTLSMSLDHASGDIDGEILAGEFAGRTLGSLTLVELKTFHRYCEHTDADAVQLLQAYIARARAGEWDEAPDDDGTKQATGNGSLSVQEAYEILALEPGATRDEVISAHRSLMGKLHPDKGGSTYLATKVNEAREVLLKTVG